MRLTIVQAYLPFVRKFDHDHGAVVQKLKLRDEETGELVIAEVGLTNVLPAGDLLVDACRYAVARYQKIKHKPQRDCRRVSNYRLLTKSAS